MMTTIQRIACAAILAVGFAPSAHAQQSDIFSGGWYGSVSGQAIEMPDQDVTFSGVGTAKVDSDLGYGLTGAVGYSYNSNARVEAELGYKNHDDVTASAGGVTSTGEYEIWSAMLNGYYDFDQGADVNWTPYVGAGIGMAQLDDGNFDDEAFAYQLMLGVNYNTSQTSQWFLGYRYFGTDDFEFTVSGTPTEATYDAHIFEIGYRFHF